MNDWNRAIHTNEQNDFNWSSETSSEADLDGADDRIRHAFRKGSTMSMTILECANVGVITANFTGFPIDVTMWRDGLDGEMEFGYVDGSFVSITIVDLFNDVGTITHDSGSPVNGTTHVGASIAEVRGSSMYVMTAGCANVYITIGKANGVPRQVDALPRQANALPRQANASPGQANAPDRQVHAPPGQVDAPPGQVNDPPGQVNDPHSQVNVPDRQVHNHLWQVDAPPSRVNVSHRKMRNRLAQVDAPPRPVDDPAPQSNAALPPNFIRYALAVAVVAMIIYNYS